MPTDIIIPGIPGNSVALATPSSPGAAPSWLPTVANNFDPSVSGLAVGTVINGTTVAIGTVVTTVDSSKAWKMWGSSPTNWVALHATTGSLAAPAQSIDVPLNCNSAGGFRVDFAALGCDSAPGATVFRLRVNGADATDANAFWVSNLYLAYSAQQALTTHNANIMGNIGTAFGTTDIGMVTMECMQPQSALGLRRIRITSCWYQATGGNPFLQTTEYVVLAATGEITSVGLWLSSTGGTAKIPAGASWRLERHS